MPRMKLSALQVAKAVPPESGRLELWDTDARGLCLRVTAGGVKSWVVRYRFGGVQRRYKLGEFPAMSLADARQEARETIRSVHLGCDPQQVKIEARRAEQSEAQTVRQVIKDYRRLYAEPRKLKKWLNDDTPKKLDKHVIPHWGDRPIVGITRSDARALLREVYSEDYPTVPAEVIQRMRPIFSWAVEEEIIEANPFERVRPVQTPGVRERVLTDKELVAVWNAAAKMGYPFGSLYQLLILTGQRRMEIATMQESWIDLEADIPVIEIPSASFKGGEWVQVVPLSGMAIEIIERLPRFSGPFMLSTRGGETPISGFSKAKAKLNELSGVADWVVHDIRRTVRTNLSKLKVDRLVAELVIGHKQQGIHAVYDRYEYGPEKRHALEAWSTRLKEIISGNSVTDNVVPLVTA